jgi:hypothetical protein
MPCLQELLAQALEHLWIRGGVNGTRHALKLEGLGGREGELLHRCVAEFPQFPGNLKGRL